MLNPDYRTLYWSNHSGRNEHILEESLVCLPLATRLLRQTFLGNLMLGEGKGVSDTWGWLEDRLFVRRDFTQAVQSPWRTNWS